MNIYYCNHTLTEREIIDSLLNSSAYPIRVNKEDYDKYEKNDVVVFSNFSKKGMILSAKIIRKQESPSPMYRVGENTKVEYMFICSLGAKVELNIIGLEI